MPEDELAYQRVKGIYGLCRLSKTLEEAKERVRKAYPEQNLDEVVEVVGHYLKRETNVRQEIKTE